MPTDASTHSSIKHFQRAPSRFLHWRSRVTKLDVECDIAARIFIRIGSQYAALAKADAPLGSPHRAACISTRSCDEIGVGITLRLKEEAIFPNTRKQDWGVEGELELDRVHSVPVGDNERGANREQRIRERHATRIDFANEYADRKTQR